MFAEAYHDFGSTEFYVNSPALFRTHDKLEVVLLLSVRCEEVIIPRQEQRALHPL